MSEEFEGGGVAEHAEVDITHKASKMGWVPLEKFKGDPQKWTDAETFVRRGDEIMPILRKNNEKLKTELDMLRGDLTKTQQLFQEAQGALTEFQKYHEEDSKRQYDRALEKLKSDKKEALSTQDYDAVVEIDEAMKVLDEQKKAQTTKKPVQANQQVDPRQDPVFTAWVADNADWYGKDKQRTAYAESIGAFISNMEPTLKGTAFLQRVADEVADKFGLPDKPTRADRVEGSRQGGGRSDGVKGYSDLPPEAKLSCDKFGAKLIGEGKAFKTQAEWRKQYVKDFFG